MPSEMAKQLAKRKFKGTRGGLVPYTQEARDSFMSGSAQMRGPMEQNMVPVTDDELAFATQQNFEAPYLPATPGEYGRPIVGGTVTELNPNFLVEDPMAQMDATQVMVTPEGEFDFGGEELAQILGPEEAALFTDEPFENYFARQGEGLEIDFGLETGALSPEVAETLLYAPNLDSYSVDRSDYRAARANRARIEEEADALLQQRQQEGMEYLRSKGL